MDDMFRTACLLSALGLATVVGCGGSAQQRDAAAQDDAAVGHDVGAQDAAAHDAADAAVQDDAATRHMDGPLATDAPACVPAPTPGPSAHNGGMDCLGCHTEFTAAGTIYTAPDSTQTVGAATVTIVGADNATHTGVTCSCGNFMITEAIAFPATVWVSKCPDTAVMVGQFSYGGCNSCHSAGDRVHLP